METLPLTPSAEDLKRRILGGENVPLEDLKEFILGSYVSLEKDRKVREKPADVDFF